MGEKTNHASFKGSISRIFKELLQLHNKNTIKKWTKEGLGYFSKEDTQKANNLIKIFLKPSVQFRSFTQSCPTLCDPMDCSMPGLPVHHQLLELAQTHVHPVGDAIQPSHPLLSLSPPAFNLAQHQGLFQGVNFSQQVAKVLDFQLQHQSFQ